MALVVPNLRQRAKLRLVLLGVVTAEQQLAPVDDNSDICLSAAAIAAVKAGEGPLGIKGCLCTILF